MLAGDCQWGLAGAWVDFLVFGNDRGGSLWFYFPMPTLPTFLRLLMILAASFWLTHCLSTTPSTASVAAEKLFTQEVKPILQQHCLRCHNGSAPDQLDLSNRVAAFMPHPSGRAYIVPGKPDESLLIEAVSREGLHQRVMPRLLVTLTDMEIGTLREWIEAGAPWPTGAAGDLRHRGGIEDP